MSGLVDLEGLGPLRATIDAALAEMRETRIVDRIWAHDHTVWKSDPDEIANRLGWLRIAEGMQESVAGIRELVDAARADGYTDALLLGMGGSSLAPEILRKTFGVADGHLDLAVLDSTDPGAVLRHTRRLDLRRTLFIVSTKSGGTVETLSFFKFFFNRVSEAVGPGEAGRHFVAITDPGSKLTEISSQHDFRATFLNDPNIGGRYSALSHFGLVPAAIVGIDIDRLLERGIEAGHECKLPPGDGNPGAALGAVIGELAKLGRDKLTLIVPDSLASFGDWVEQLIAESTGKEGSGILPVVGESFGDPGVYGGDRVFVCLRLEDDRGHDEAVGALRSAGHPVVAMSVDGRHDLGRQFFVWEMATAVAGHRLGINPFDQPDVEAAKVLAREAVAAYGRDGKLPEMSPAVIAEGIAVYGDVQASTPEAALTEFLDRAVPGGYIAIQAYVEPTPGIDEALTVLRTRLRDRTGLATTVGYGPRFLHSTGQLHKGDAGRGLFVQITSDSSEDAPIPDRAGHGGSSMTFSVLKMAQALGDRRALLDAGRKVLGFHVGSDVAGALALLQRDEVR